MNDIACINVEFMGGSEKCTFDRFADVHIQDDATAERIARDMIAGDDPYEINDDFPQTFTILDRAALEAQLLQLDE